MVRSKKKSSPIPLYNAKKYRQISQRHMTTSSESLVVTEQQVKKDKAHNEKGDSTVSQIPSNIVQQQEQEDDDNPYNSYMADDIIYERKKKKQKSSSTSTASEPLTVEEVKLASQQQKQLQRKQQQIQQRQQQKLKRTLLYQSLEQHSILGGSGTSSSSSSSVSKQQQQQSQQHLHRLLNKSSQIQQKRTKRQCLERALYKEQNHIELTNEEHDLLYEKPAVVPTEMNDIDTNKKIYTNPIATEIATIANNRYNDEAATPSSSSTTTTTRPITVAQQMMSSIQSLQKQQGKIKITKNKEIDETQSTALLNKGSTTKSINNNDDPLISTERDPAPAATLPTTKVKSIAEQMMASLVSLQHQQSNDKAIPSTSAADIEQVISKTVIAPQKKYIPSDPIILQTTQSYSTTTHTVDTQDSTTTKIEKGYRIRKVCANRPSTIQQIRYDLPVVQMEYEIMDRINNHDIIIICSETGSGKSTQIPQFLYEAGYSTPHNETSNGISGGGGGGIIGITQPRRVAAISCAKRVCYEMGYGNGQTISKSNVVSYQTRYESVGYSKSVTEIQFMTDGILLQEIRNDLLLRKYNVIVLDEAHERNINTDILIGLLSIAIPLRNDACKKQQQEQGISNDSASTLHPLKLIIMSATLRVEDFTSTPASINSKNVLFSNPNYQPTVINIPGRTFPVTIHHNKVTELYKYEDAVFHKTCKIHRQLPPGGILIFLTGKQEIVRLVNRLRHALQVEQKQSHQLDDTAISSPVSGTMDSLPENDDNFVLRDMDDDEVDGDIWEKSIFSNEDTTLTSSKLDDNQSTTVANNIDETEKPLIPIILPLYSLLSAEEQARVFAPVPEGYRLIVVATNIAETSLTIPGVTYVVDSGRQKCRNYNATTGIASFDIMWISKAAADQRAGRAGRTGPGHCYRIYSSSLYSRYMDEFALPEVLTRPLEDVVLSMKAMNILNINDFPFPTPPDKSQIKAAIQLLANIGCLDISMADNDDTYDGKDGVITRLGSAVAKLPLGVRYSKILLVAAEAGVLDYAIPIVATLSEVSPFVVSGQVKESEDTDIVDWEDNNARQSDASTVNDSMKKSIHRWSHRGGDVLAALLAVGAYTYAGRGLNGNTEKSACKKFCEENGLHPVVMDRIQQMRRHLSQLAKSRLPNVDGVAARTGGFTFSMSPPNKLQEQLLCQSIASGLLDNVAMLAPLGSIPGQHPFSLRSAYLSCSSNVKEPLFIDTNSVVYSRDARRLPKWICYETLIRKTLKDGITSIAIMKKITPIDPAWLGRLAEGSRLLNLGEPIPSPLPSYDHDKDAVLCSVLTKFGCYGWEVPPVQRDMFTELNKQQLKSAVYMSDDSFRWFARFLLEGKVFQELKSAIDMYNDHPSIITRRQNITGVNQQSNIAKVTLLVNALVQNGIDSAAALRKHWTEVDSKYLFNIMKRWVKAEFVSNFQTIWIKCVKENIVIWKQSKVGK